MPPPRFGSRIVKTRGSWMLAATITADSPIDSAAPGAVGEVSPELRLAGAAMARDNGMHSACGDMAAEGQGIADQANRFEAAAGTAPDDFAEAEDGAPDRPVDGGAF